MKVLVGVHHFPPKYRGGAEWRAHRTATALIRAGHQATVVCVEQVDDRRAAPLSVSEEVFEGVPVHRLFFDLAAAPDPLRWEYDNPWIGEYLRERFSVYRPDIFHLISGYLLTGSALQAAEDAGIATVVTLTDFWFLCRRVSMLRTDGTLSTLPIDFLRCARCLGEEKRRFRLAARLAPNVMNFYWRLQGQYRNYFQERWQFLQARLANVDLAICPSQFLRTMYHEAGMEARRVVFLRQGHTFGRMADADVAKTPSPVLRIGYLGQLAPLKGVHVLVAAMQLLTAQPLELHIYGDSSLHPDYSDDLRRTTQRDSRIHLHGVYERSQLTSILRNLDVIVVPSIWYENSPNVILEAFAHATPVVASDFGGMAELVTSETNGLHFAVGDAAALARQLRRLVDEPALLPHLTQGASATTPPTLDTELTELLALYQSVLCPD
jgi:glycosyltransferase involved in cell wall biosynthesis